MKSKYYVGDTVFMPYPTYGGHTVLFFKLSHITSKRALVDLIGSLKDESGKYMVPNLEKFRKQNYVPEDTGFGNDWHCGHDYQCRINSDGTLSLRWYSNGYVLSVWDGNPIDMQSMEKNLELYKNGDY